MTVPSSEVAAYCLHAVAAAPAMRSKAGTRWPVAVAMDGLAADR